MIWSGVIFVVCFISLIYFLRGLVRVTHSREFRREHERLREARQVRRIARRGK
jgi:hypothetical protein